MRILMATPALPDSVKGNGVTARRWTEILRRLGHAVKVSTGYEEGDHELLIALHARRGAAAIRRFRRRHPERPIVLALTGTDLYGGLDTSPEARQALETATRIVVLQREAKGGLPESMRPRTHVIVQSATPPDRPPAQRTSVFEVCVASHLRRVKDPLRAAYASRLLPEESRIRIEHYGMDLDRGIARRARQESERNRRYRWHGVVAAPVLKRRLARSRMLVLSSKSEGGANVLSEAIVCGVPVICSRIPGSVGVLGEGYPGYFEVGDTRALADALHAAETDTDFLRSLSDACDRLRDGFRPEREIEAWRRLLESL